MSTFVLVPGAGGDSWYWHRVVPLLEQAGHSPIDLEQPGDDARAGLDLYVDRTLTAMADRRDVILVAQSLGGFTAAMVCARVPVRMLVLVNAMIPLPDETAGDWWDHVGSTAARVEAARRHGYSPEFDVSTYFLHDLPPDVLAASDKHARPEADVVFGQPCRFERWPKVPIHVVVARHDRVLPVELQKKIVHERLGRSADEVDGGHLVALSNPRRLADRLLSYLG
ncbi:MAG: alpha/beta fold hydrolase [Polyangiaceae bacterium]